VTAQGSTRFISSRFATRCRRPPQQRDTRDSEGLADADEEAASAAASALAAARPGPPWVLTATATTTKTISVSRLVRSACGTRRSGVGRDIAIDCNRRTGRSPLVIRPDGYDRGGDSSSTSTGGPTVASRCPAGLQGQLRELEPDDHPVVVMGDRDRLSA